MDYRQADRLITLGSPLGDDVLLLEAFAGKETISQLFQYTLDVLSTRDDIRGEEIVGKNVTITLRRLDEDRRYFNGFVRRFAGGHRVVQGLRRYSMEIVPWLWFLTRSTDCRIFQEKSAKEIIEQIFIEYGFQNYDFSNVIGGSRKRDYCVQYEESDFAFVSRLMEEEGIFYWFSHENGKHTLMLGDNIGAYAECDPAEFPFSAGTKAANHIHGWEHAFEFRSGRHSATDYNYLKPGAKLAVEELTMLPLSDSGSFGVFDYPGGYYERDVGTELVRIRMEEEEWPYELVHGSTEARGLRVGGKFTLTSHETESEAGKTYLVIQMNHSVTTRSYTAGSSGTDAYAATFSAIPAETIYRSPRSTPKPRIAGLQPAIVVGKEGEEIYTDEYGRVKVQFFWDRRGAMNEKSSCWLRVIYGLAGKKWGMFGLPRVGHEVAVAFVEGDPDRPVIVGSLYNDWARPPYDLPAEKTKSTTKTMASKGGGGFNEIRFEDKKGSEQFFLHAERNQDNRVKKDSLEWVGRNRHLIVKTNQVEKVEGDKHLTVKGDHNEKVDGTISLEAVMDMQEKVGMKYALDAGMEIHLKGGMNVVIEAGMSVTLKAGGGFVVVGPAGVMISGTPVLINSGGSAGSGSGSSPESPEEPELADTAEPGELVELPPPPVPPEIAPPDMGPVQAKVLKQAAESGTPFCEKCEAARRAQQEQTGA